MTGSTLAHYQILEPLGAGGMGEVYRARDTRLDRSVAVKVLPVHIAQREDALARFEREARTVASLHHPNICVLHDIGQQDGVNFLVMELIEGETLAARIEKGPIPLDQALTFATQIADALDRAHRAGVTHRDIKPQNIMLTRDGVKVLDFGLAKSTANKPGPTEATLTNALTTEGTVLGTPQYMAPEQFEGKEADARSDIWAFGAVLYEMVTGKKAFQGKNYASLVTAILAADPPPMAVKPFTPAWLERLVKRCLQKDPEDRYLALHDVVLDLKSPPPVEPVAPPSRLRWVPLAVGAALALVVAIGWGGSLRNSSPAILPVALTVDPPEGSVFTPLGDSGGSAISPDGRTLAFVATNEKGETLLYVRPLESLAARPLTGTENAGRPFWSPDGKSLAFIAGSKLKRIDLAGGAAVNLCDATSARGGDWSQEGVIIFGDLLKGIQRISAAGGTPSLVTEVNREAGETSHYYPQFLPDSRKFLYAVRHSDPSKMGIAMGSLDVAPARTSAIIAQTEFKARYHAASGRLLYVQEGKGNYMLMSRRVEWSPPRLTGDPVTVAEGLRIAPSNGYADFSLSESGTLFYSQEPELWQMRFRWRDRSGRPLGTIGEFVRSTSSFSLSPDGARVAYSVDSASTIDVWMMDLARGLSTRISFNHGRGVRWSPDGKYLYYSNETGIHRKAADGSGVEETLLTETVSPALVNSVSPDGKALLFGLGDIKILRLTGDSKPEPYLQTKFHEANAAFSPDGRWVAYSSNESGPPQIYIQGYPEKRGKWLISGSGGTAPAWRPDGKELYWVALDGALMAAGIELHSGGVHPGRPEALFTATAGSSWSQPTLDGRRFLTLEPEAAQRPLPMVVVQNWAARLEK